MSQQFAQDYIDVATRIVEFRTKYPDGSLQPADLATPYKIEPIGDSTWIVVVAAAYRTPDDPRPGVGMAYEQFPGKTPYTKGSELQNAETSAWGRAIVAALAADTKKGSAIASAEEVQNRATEPVVTARQEIWQVAKQKGWVAEDGSYQDLQHDFASWSNGEQIENADQVVLKRYLTHITPHRKMRRANGNGEQKP